MKPSRQARERNFICENICERGEEGACADFLKHYGNALKNLRLNFDLIVVNSQTSERCVRHALANTWWTARHDCRSGTHPRAGCSRCKRLIGNGGGRVSAAMTGAASISRLLLSPVLQTRVYVTVGRRNISHCHNIYPPLWRAVPN